MKSAPDLDSTVKMAQRFELLRKTAESSDGSRSLICRRVDKQHSRMMRMVMLSASDVSELQCKAQSMVAQTLTQKQQAGEDHGKRKNHRQKTIAKEVKNSEASVTIIF